MTVSTAQAAIRSSELISTAPLLNNFPTIPPFFGIDNTTPPTHHICSMESPSTVENSEPQVVFRPSKKRKQFLRQRAERNDTTANDADSQAAAPLKPPYESDSRPHDGDDKNTSEIEGLSVAEALRLRNARKSRLKGVEFRPEGAPKEEAPVEHTLVNKDDEHGPEAMEYGMSRRFAPQAGLVGELVNKHM